MHRRRVVLALTVLLISAGAAAAGDAVALDTSVRSVALFKNGLGYFVRVGELPAAPSEIEIGPLPAAVHGTFWLGWNEGVAFTDLRSHEVKAQVTREALSIEELLRANEGARARIFLREEPRPVTGRIVSVPRAPEPPPPVPYLSVIPPPQPPQAASLLLLEADGETVGVPLHSVLRVVILDEAATQVPVDSKHVALTGTLARGEAGQPLSVSYLVKGITWAPSYQVDISDEEKARLTAKAAILNEVEDLTDTHVDLITGFPYLEFSEIISPMARKTDLAGFLNALYRGEAGRRGGYGGTAGAMAQVALNVPMEYAMQAPVPDYGAPVEGVVAEDLFFYPLEEVTLARGETGYYPLFSAQVPYGHVYTWEIPDYVSDSARYERPQQERRQIVWHSLRLHNEMGMPWTTAPAETVQEGRILGQATLHYTPRGGETLLKITQALGINAEEIEVEIARQPNAATFHDSRYDLVTVQGTLKLRSHLDKAVDMEITKLLSGEVEEMSPEGEVTKLAAGLQSVNPRSRVIWKLELPAGEELEITYSYRLYVR
ncbi:MAG: hypothetical protein AB7Y46_16095 [Armatimonadota bacterium]